MHEILVVHIGKPDKEVDVEDEERQFEKTIEALLPTLEREEIVLALETDASPRSKLVRLPHLMSLAKKYAGHITVCLDTEHAYASGYVLSETDYEQAPQYVSVVHLNPVPDGTTADKKVKFASGLDRHSNTPIAEDYKNIPYLVLVDRLQRKGVPVIFERVPVPMLLSDAERWGKRILLLEKQNERESVERKFGVGSFPVSSTSLHSER